MMPLTWTPRRPAAAGLCAALAAALLAGCSHLGPPPGAAATPTAAASPADQAAIQAMNNLRRKLAGANQDALNQSLQDALRAGQAALARRDTATARAALAPLARFGTVADFPSIPLQVLQASLAQAQLPPNDAAFKRHAMLGTELTSRYRNEATRPSSAEQPIPVLTRFELRERLDALGWTLNGDPVPQPPRPGSPTVMLLNAKDDRGGPRALYFRLDYLPPAKP